MSVFRNQNGEKWTARFRWRTGGKQYSISKTFTNKADAENWELQKKIEHLQGVDKKLTRFLWLYDKYFDTYKKDYIRQRSREQWDYVRSKFEDFFGEERTVQSIKLDDYQSFLNSLNSKLTHKTLLTIHRTLSQVFNYAVQSGYINRNPADLARVGGKKDREVTYLSIAQIEKVLDFCRHHHFPAREGKHVQVGTPILIEAAILSGCRLGELAGLTWDYIDVEKSVFHIRRQLSTRNHRTPEFIPLKTDSSNRDVPVPHYLIDDMQKLHSDGDELIFYTQRNLPISTSSASRYTHRMLDKLKIDATNFHFHSFRHSHVALLLANGVDIYAISKRLGHSNIRTTMEIYSYLMDEKKDEEDKKILNVLNGLEEQTSDQ
ncbi:tyrosine-type recombinase/integrase [Limosilactobacillus oris]|uniref:tyrosine-type recombinase/integrase n=1 Tax=Limosilactobacillus oris TaxID=1632 RepID=UPI0024B35FE2|nr:site-specific integrase [Limosilactobacillus oris]WHO86392.1 tyrosine-type recombinase/integrase [Limosilactobacillus oris]